MKGDIASLMHPEHAAHSGADTFYAVLRHGMAAGILDGTDVPRLQSELYTLLAQETTRFTMGDSSSIPVETAQSLYRSICFCLGLRLKRAGNPAIGAALLKEQPLSTLFTEGRTLVREEVGRGNALLTALQTAGFQTRNLAYLNTLHEALPGFFLRYDFWHGMHDIPCMIDYPLLIPVEGEGIAYINAYLDHLSIETRFLLQFDPKAVSRLLRGHCPEPDEALINLFEPVYCNAIGRALLNKDILPLNIRNADRAALWRLFENSPNEQLAELLHRACGKLLSIDAFGGDAVLCAYLRRAETELLARLLSQKNESALAGIFTAFPVAEQKKPIIHYRKRKTMDDEALRSLIEELRDMRFLSDKLVLLKCKVRSLEDWLEIIPLCFEDEELPTVFSMLSSEELAALLRRLNNLYLNGPEQEPEPWETEFMRFIGQLEETKKSEIRLLTQADWKE